MQEENSPGETTVEVERRPDEGFDLFVNGIALPYQEMLVRIGADGTVTVLQITFSDRKSYA